MPVHAGAQAEGGRAEPPERDFADVMGRQGLNMAARGRSAFWHCVNAETG